MSSDNKSFVPYLEKIELIFSETSKFITKTDKPKKLKNMELKRLDIRAKKKFIPISKYAQKSISTTKKSEDGYYYRLLTGKQVWIGPYVSEIEAVLARDNAVKRYRDHTRREELKYENFMKSLGFNEDEIW